MCQHSLLRNDRRRFLQGMAGLGSSLWLGTLVSSISIETQAAKRVSKSRRRAAKLATTGSLHSQGCSLIGSQSAGIIAHLSQLAAAGQTSQALLQSSGDARLDSSLGVLLADLAGKLQVRPGFAFYDDAQANNALAMEDSYLPDTQGTVLFGSNLLQQQINGTQYGDMAIMGICAHEFAHIVQYNRSIKQRLLKGQETMKRLELHADFLAGYYIGRRNMEVDYSGNQLVALGRAWEELGDTDFSDPLHHGSRQERVQAVEMGHRMATAGGASLEEAVAGGLYYLRA